MKTVRILLLIYILSFLCALGISFVNDTLVVGYELQDRLIEAAIVAIPVFIVLTLLYVIIRLAVKATKAVKKKKPSTNEGLEKN